jgi:predicted dehydrogenase
LYTNLHEAISSRDSSKLEVKAEQAVDVLRLIELGLQSSREGRIMHVSS